MKPSTRFWDWSARRYDKYTREDEALARRVETIAKHLEPDDTVLDYACGSGVVTCRIAPLVKEAHGIDISGGMIDLAKQKACERGLSNVHFAQQTVFDETLERNRYDVILALNILHLVEDASRAVRRVAELLKPGGLMIALIPCVGEASVFLRMLVPIIRIVISSPFRSFRIVEVSELLRAEGFEVLESEHRKRMITLCYVVARKE